MSKDRDADLSALLKAVLSADDLDPDEVPEPEPAVSEFALKLGEAMGVAIASMRNDGIIEVNDDSMEGLIAEVTEAGLDTKSPKQLIKRVIKTLLESDYVEEVYGTDDAISASLRGLLGGD